MLSSFEAVLDPAELDRVPSVDDLPGQAPQLDPLGWLATLLGGCALAAVGAGFALLLSATTRDDLIVSAVLIVVGGLLLKFLPRVVPLFDVRIVTAVAAAILVVLTIVPPARVASAGGGRVGFAAVAVAFGLLSVRLWRQVSAASAEVDAWNTAYAALASAPCRATRTELHVQAVSLGRGSTLDGAVTFADAEGAEHTVPLISMNVMRVVIAAGQRVVEPLQYAVWHDSARSIVVTRVLVTDEAGA